MNEDKITKDFEYGIGSRYISEEERSSDAQSLMEARLARMKSIKPHDVIRAKLLQLNYLMEDFLHSSFNEEGNYFIQFLIRYINTIYDQRNKFAEDMDISAVKLSQILNNHREPQDEFFLKLMVHSEMVFENIGSFNTEIWYMVYFHEKVGETLIRLSERKPELEKKVKTKNLIKGSTA